MYTKDQLEIYRLKPADIELIELVASWYYQEWKVPVEKTVNRIKNFPEEGFPFHLVFLFEGKPVATGGLYTDDGMGLPTLMPEYRNRFVPWVALLYTLPEIRGEGLGAVIATVIEGLGVSMGYNTQYLYTFTAERLYTRLGWEVVERLNYNGNENTVIMKKTFS